MVSPWADLPPKVHQRSFHVTCFLCNAIFYTWWEKWFKTSWKFDKHDLYSRLSSSFDSSVTLNFTLKTNLLLHEWLVSTTSKFTHNIKGKLGKLSFHHRCYRLRPIMIALHIGYMSIIKTQKVSTIILHDMKQTQGVKHMYWLKRRKRGHKFKHFQILSVILNIYFIYLIGPLHPKKKLVAQFSNLKCHLNWQKLTRTYRVALEVDKRDNMRHLKL